LELIDPLANGLFPERSGITNRILSEVSPGVKVEESEVDGGGWQRSGEHFGRNQLDETAGESMGIESSRRVALRRGSAGCEVVGEW